MPDWVEKYQSGLGALLGLFSLATVTWVNYAINRRIERRRVEHERAMVARALLEEVRECQEVLRIRIDSMSTESPATFKDLWLTQVPVYSATVNKIGLCSADLVKALVGYYAQIYRVYGDIGEAGVPAAERPDVLRRAERCRASGETVVALLQATIGESSPASGPCSVSVVISD